MSNKMQKRLPLVFVIALAIVLASLMTFSVADIANADAQKTPTNSLTFGQFSDIHYFPIDDCYQDIKNPNYTDSDFYKSMTGDTKLVMESGMILKQQIEQFIADAKEGKAPLYLFASGDLSKNGEVTALVDVANALRYLQNTVRGLGGKYANFQVFATPGNHDLYNTSGALYSKENGSKRVSDALCTMQFALVFAGLGYPDANIGGEGGAIDLTDYLPENYWFGEYTTTYIPSTNAKTLDIHYYNEHLEKVATTLKDASSTAKLKEYYQIGDDNNSLSLTAKINVEGLKDYAIMVIDAHDRESVEPGETGAYVRVSRDEYEIRKGNKQQNGENYTYYGATEEGAVDTTKTIDPQAAFNSDENAVVFRSTGLDHLCGGRLTEGVLDWMEKFCDARNAASTLGEATIITCFHQNALPHWEMEDEILKDFTIYNWENTAKRLLDMGARYVFTGHMHVCDAMTYTDVEGRTLYDFQTGSCVSYYSPRRYTTLERYDFDGKLGETCISSVYCLDDIKDADGNSRPFKEVPSHNVFTAPAFNQSTFENAYTTYKNNKTKDNWNKVVETNPDYLGYIINYENMNELGYNDYINEQIYGVLVDRIVSHFINQDTIDSLVGTVEGFVDGFVGSGSPLVKIVLGGVFPQFSKKDEPEDYNKYGRSISYNEQVEAVNGIVDYLLDTVLEGVTYKHNGKDYNTALSLVEAVVNEILDWEYGDDSITSTVNPANSGKMGVKDIASFIMTAHTIGNEISLDETAESIKAIYGEEEKVPEDKDYMFKHPYNPTYRLRMVEAVKDMHEQLVSGKFVQDLLKTLLDPIFTEDGSLLKTILNNKFDFSDAVENGYITENAYGHLKKGLGSQLPSLLKNAAVTGALKGMGIEVSLPDDFSIDVDNFVLVDIVNDLLPVIKPVVAKLLGFSLEGPDIISIAQNFLDSYLVDSFYKGLGGIADDIVITFATDVYPDMDDFSDPNKPSHFQPEKAYVKDGVRLSYLSTLNKVSTVGASFNAATQDNGRVPSRVTANFDTTNSTTSYTIKFYTEENVYGTFRLLDEDGNVVGEVGTSQKEAFTAYASNPTDYLDTTAYKDFGNGINATVFTQTKPQYIPLIDLGLLCITHAEIMHDTDEAKDVPYKYGERDAAVANSVIYWNVHTVTINGLEAGKTYYYDILGNYETDKTNYFSLVDFIKTQGYDGNALTFTTAADRSVESFEFLTIADIQGMIQSMYDNSHKAVDALLKDENVNDFDFILNAGDMCDNGKNFNQWGMALNTYQDLTLNTSVFFTSGNHENNTGAMGRYFNYTVKDGEGTKAIDGEYYSFDYANAHFTVLDTNDATTDGLGKDQLAWLENDLKNTDAKWKFVLMHKSLYSAGSHAFDGEVIAMRSQLGKLFAENGVNMVFGGHDHTYTTTVLVDKDGNAVDVKDSDGLRYTGDGVLYITLGTLGTKFYTYRENDMTTDKFDENNSILHTLDTQTFGKVVVGKDSITFTGYKFNRETGKIEIVGSSAVKPGISPVETSDDNHKLMVILLSTLIPGVALVGLGTGLGIFFAKKKKAN